MRFIFAKKKDYSKAKYWWEKSAAQGYSIAKSDLELYFSPEAVAKRQAEKEREKFIEENFGIINGVLIKYLGNGGNVTIPSGVIQIGRSAFSWNNKVPSVTIPSGITVINGGTFRDCPNLKSISIPDGVTKIEWNAFYCSGLTSVYIPNSVTEIGEYAFCCKGLKSVTVPKNCNVNKKAFPEDCVVKRK